MSDKVQHTNILSISGEGRNVGKTLLACDIIAKFSRKADIVGVKITPHLHKNVGAAELIESREGLLIHKETDTGASKDTSRMLAAGAVEAYLIQLSDDKFVEALSFIEKKTGRNSLIICESGRLPARIQAGISLFIRQLNCQVCELEKKIPLSDIDRVVSYTVNSFDIDLNLIEIVNGSWKLKKDLHHA